MVSLRYAERRRWGVLGVADSGEQIAERRERVAGIALNYYFCTIDKVLIMGALYYFRAISPKFNT